MRRAFSLVTAIFFMVLVATIATFALNLSATTAKHTTDIFLREQAELIAQSAAEIAIQKILNDTNPIGASNCLVGKKVINEEPFKPEGKDPYLFKITVTVVNLFGDFNGCGTNISTPESIGTVTLDIEVSSNENIIKTPIRFHRRTIQKL